ncbi:hypothetical protein [Streptomyces sp. NPDC048277]|uniref:hypothetical protein n=1 Tax=Streptomyces sp. NPDC048277 TaxID=3155027 RepID=UPI00340ECAB3
MQLERAEGHLAESGGGVGVVGGSEVGDGEVEVGAEVWSYTVEHDDLVIPVGPAGNEENIRLALETLIIPFGTRAESAEIYLREWRRMWQSFKSEYILGTASATVKRVDSGQVEIGDFYGQFETCIMNVEEFERSLEFLIHFLRLRHSRSADPRK